MNSGRTARFLLAIWSVALVVFFFTALAAAGNKPPSGGGGHGGGVVDRIPLPSPIQAVVEAVIPAAVALVRAAQPDRIADPVVVGMPKVRIVDPAAIP